MSIIRQFLKTVRQRAQVREDRVGYAAIAGACIGGAVGAYYSAPLTYDADFFEVVFIPCAGVLTGALAGGMAGVAPPLLVVYTSVGAGAYLARARARRDSALAHRAASM